MANGIEIIKKTLSKTSTNLLKEMISKLMYNYEDGAGLVFNLALSELETRLPESEYVLFCDSL
jgi:hypothetical protein